ncbi:MAG: DUF6054 family protein [Bulleidia sp.]
MAKIEKTVYEDLGSLVNRIESGILEGSMSASLEDGTDWKVEDVCCSVRVFERYSYMGGNRVSMNVTLIQKGSGPVYLSAITSGGSQAVFWKINTFGEEAFLEKLEEIL